MTRNHHQTGHSKARPKVASVKQVLSFVRPHWRPFLGAMLALGLASGINLLFPEIIRRLLNSSNMRVLAEHWALIAMALVLLFAIQGVAFYFRAFLFAIVGQRVVAQLRERIFHNIVHRSIQFFDEAKSSDLVSRLGNDTQLLQDAVSIKLSVVIRYALQVLVGLGLMAYLSIGLTLTTLLILPLLVGLSLGLAKKLRHYSKLQQTELAQALTIAQEAFEGIRVVKAFNREQHEEKRFDSTNNRVLGIGADRARISAFFQSFVSFLLNAAIVFVLFLGIHLVDTSRLSFGDLTAFLLYGAIVAVSFSLVAAAFTELLQSMGAADRIIDFLGNPSADASKDIKTLSDKINSIRFDAVSFAYPARPDVQVLRDISFTLARGTTTAIVGPSGAGKTSIIQLLLGFYQPSSGSITLDGTLLSAENTAQFREHVAIVPQDQILFAASIGENVRYGNLSASASEVREACRQANILDFILGLPQQFDTPVGERGVQLSMGQKQRLAIARAILRNPQLLILDEATSALDSENEHQIQEALSRMLVDRTALIIAHRLSTIRRAHQVLVVSNGKVVQAGTHESLSAQPGLYRQLVERQELLSDSHAA
ncbi:MAG: ATP-binding cassette domain-containing protein [Oligoflexia bacterium]|nr:ATP-binding cassette domain-containing protein [Oligoflexia bacterium]